MLIFGCTIYEANVGNSIGFLREQNISLECIRFLANSADQNLYTFTTHLCKRCMNP